MIKCILFDFWGTLVENGIYPSPVKQAKYILRLPMPFKDYVVRFEKAMMTKPHEDLNEAFDSVFSEFSINPKTFVKEKLVGMWNKNEMLGKPFLDTIETLQYLKSKGIKIGLISNTTPTITRVIEKYSLGEYFNAVVYSYEEGLLKTDPEMFIRALERLGTDREEVIMIGDSIQTDVMGARNAGIASILLDRTNKRTFDPKIVSLRDIKRLLESGELEEFAAREVLEDQPE